MISVFEPDFWAELFQFLLINDEDNFIWLRLALKNWLRSLEIKSPPNTPSVAHGEYVERKKKKKNNTKMQKGTSTNPHYHQKKKRGEKTNKKKNPDRAGRVSKTRTLFHAEHLFFPPDHSMAKREKRKISSGDR
ncbi:hypothetical protein CEXT_118961 [Caerostris extrusa]|uniref:Uncharacterized protein n=1 Tax=Caerostris extrusa TaxID=172846 RepID=A0AAV4XZ34_CAEEX|nr:hypothetical protein CEXT_118961 [Caerostris extrusa]